MLRQSNEGANNKTKLRMQFCVFGIVVAVVVWVFCGSLIVLTNTVSVDSDDITKSDILRRLKHDL
jgi:hypothetical protein